MSRLLAYFFGLGTVALVASPLSWEPGRDSYPLSTYPMFSGRRDKPTLFFMQAIDQAGQIRRVAPEFIATDEVMQADATVRRAVTAGPPGPDQLCERVAKRIAESSTHGTIAHVEVVSARFDPVTYFEKGDGAESRTLHSRCKVPSHRESAP